MDTNVHEAENREDFLCPLKTRHGGQAAKGREISEKKIICFVRVVSWALSLSTIRDIRVICGRLPLFVFIGVHSWLVRCEFFT
jgi:hypothetical protein